LCSLAGLVLSFIECFTLLVIATLRRLLLLEFALNLQPTVTGRSLA